jgi:predicted DNA-binding protein
MTLSILLSPETEARLKGEASRQGLDAADYARKLLEVALSKPAPDQASIDVLTKWERDNATDDPDEIARRQKEFEEFKEAMNRNRLEMEGPLSRKPFP